MAQRNNYSNLAEGEVRSVTPPAKNTRNPLTPEERQREVVRRNALANWEGEGGHLPEPDDKSQNGGVSETPKP